MTTPTDRPPDCEHPPCDPDDAPCPACVKYWDRMVAEGYWNHKRRRWTDKGWLEITK